MTLKFPEHKMSPCARVNEVNAREAEATADILDPAPAIPDEPEPEKERPPSEIVWRNVILMAVLHIAAVYGLFLIPHAKLATLGWSEY